MKIQQLLFKLLRKQNVTGGRTHRQTDNVKTVYHTTNKVCGGGGGGGIKKVYNNKNDCNIQSKRHTCSDNAPISPHNVLFVVLLYVPVNSWSWRDGQFTYPHFFLGKLEQAVNQYFVHILSIITDNNPWMNQWKGGE